MSSSAAEPPKGSNASAPAPGPGPSGGRIGAPLGDLWKAAARRTSWVTGLFCVAVAALLLWNHWRSLASDPIQAPALVELKKALGRAPADEALKERIRALDLELRRTHARHLTRQARGAWLLFGGGILFLISIGYATYRKKLPRPPRSPEEAQRRALVHGQWAVGALAVAACAAAWWGGHHATTAIRETPGPGTAVAPGSAPALTPALSSSSGASPGNPAAAVPVPTPATPFPSAEEIRVQWPRFRGPGGLGVSPHTNVSLAWNVQSGQGVRWKSPVPLSVPNSPVVWGERVFLTGASAKKHEVYAFDAASGKPLWQTPVTTEASAKAEAPTVMEDSGGHAPSTAATDGRRVYAIFANGDLAALDLSGAAVWVKNLGRPENSYGHASSLELYQDKLLVQLDQGEAKEGRSKLLAFRTQTGELAWESPPRPVPNSWSTPIVIHDGKRDQIVTTANPWVIAHDPANGAELWRAKLMTGEVTPSAIFAGGFVLTAMEGERLNAIRPDGAGDVTATHVAWRAEDGLPDICCPLSDGQRVYLLNTYGVFTCYRLADGTKLWDHDFGIEFHASPSLVGDRVLLVSDSGVAVVVAAADAFKELGRSELGEKVLASPAFADGRVLIRGKQNLFCLGAK